MSNPKTIIIAEAGVNHNGILDNAYKLVDAALDAGADVIKFQVFSTDDLVIADAEMATYQKENLKSNKTQYEMLRGLELSKNEFSLLKKYCDEKKIEFMASAFDLESVDFLEPLVLRYKIPSGEITNLPYLKRIAEKKKPIILSTGMSDLTEIEKAIAVIEAADPEADLTLLHCTSNYPTPFEEVNLLALDTLKNHFNKLVGYSDHTVGLEVSLAAVARGACVIEKHFTLDRNMEGPDHKSSLEPFELKELVRMVRNIEKAFGDGLKKPSPSEELIKRGVRKSIVAGKEMKAGYQVMDKDLCLKRPGIGLAPENMEKLVGRTLKTDVKKDHIFTWNDFVEEQSYNKLESGDKLYDK